jgi:hypothetical protein
MRRVEALVHRCHTVTLPNLFLALDEVTAASPRSRRRTRYIGAVDRSLLAVRPVKLFDFVIS